MIVLFGNFDADRKILVEQYKNIDWNVIEGPSINEIENECENIENSLYGESKSVIKSYIMKTILENAKISILDCEWFVDKINHDYLMHRIREKWQNNINENEMRDILSKYYEANNSLAFTGNVDFGHSAPDWENVVNLGFFGLRERLNNYPDSEFYQCSKRVLDASIEYIRRLSVKAKECGNKRMTEVSKRLEYLTSHKPQTLWDAMQTIFLYYNIHHHIEAENLRSIGRLDKLLYPFYKRDIENGVCTEEQAREWVCHLLIKFFSIGDYANIPFCICGIDSDGVDITNEFTYIILEEYVKLDIHDPKIHIRYNRNTPDKIFEIVLNSIRDGKNSFVFMNDDVAVDSLVNIGQNIRDAQNYVIIGCYEPASSGKEVPCTCNGTINLPKAIEITLNNGCDMLTQQKIGHDHGLEFINFDDFMCAVKQQVKYFIDCSIEKINSFEKYYMDINPSPLFSSTIDECVQSGTDVYAGGAKYNNSSIVLLGIANAVDSLLVIKKLVFEDKKITLKELSQILKSNWENNEELRNYCLNLNEKYGNHSKVADIITKDICEFSANNINGKSNSRGGAYRCGIFSIDWRIPYGEKTAASADGRLHYEPLSKNMCAVVGKDRNGVTALMHTATAIDHRKIPDGVVLDIALHPTVVSGDEGFIALKGLVKSYMKLGGMALQINILDSNTLKNAQKEPEKYKNLQVRLCGWNVLFVDLSREEQNFFIEQSEALC